MVDRRELHIGGTWVQPTGTRLIDVIDPATEAIVGRVPEGSAADVDRAVNAARRAAQSWAATPATERAALCERLAAALDPLIPDLGTLISSEVGTPLPAAALLQGASMSVALRQYARSLGPIPGTPRATAACSSGSRSGLSRRSPPGTIR